MNSGPTHEPGPPEEADVPTRIADALESVASKARSLTVDKAEAIAKWGALGIVLFFLALMALIFLLVGIARILGEVLGNQEVAYAVIGGLFFVGALLMWSQRTKRDKEIDG